MPVKAKVRTLERAMRIACFAATIAHIARDRAKLNEAIRCGNDAEAARQAADLARDQRELRALQSGQNARYYNAPYRRGWSFRFGWR